MPYLLPKTEDLTRRDHGIVQVPRGYAEILDFAPLQGDHLWFHGFGTTSPLPGVTPVRSAGACRPPLPCS
jgi:hypothetical protein